MTTKKEAKFESDKLTLEKGKNLSFIDKSGDESGACDILNVSYDNYLIIKENLRDITNDEIKSLEMSKEETIEKLRDSYLQIRKILEYYLDLKDEYYSLISLWIIGTYFHDNFESYPYLFFNAMRGSGKSRTLKLACKLSKDGQVMASPTEATLFRSKGTLGIDEFERVANKDKSSIRELLNGAYKKGIKIQRMKKVKNVGGEDYVVEEFDVFRPVIMANIWGMDEVLGDRCISLVLEKSDDDMKTRLTEDFESNILFQNIKKTLNQCSLCSVVSIKNINSTWNNYISERHKTTLYTYNTYNTYNTQSTSSPSNQALFNKIYDSGIKGRNLELFLPLCFMAKFIGEDILEELVEIAVKLTNERKHEEEIENIDIRVYDFVSKQDVSLEYESIKQLLEQFKHFSDESGEWLNTHWFGRSLKRLGLVLDKRRKGHGIEVRLNVKKAKEKIMMFETKEKKE